jgi:serine/threonine protein kinase
MNPLSPFAAEWPAISALLDEVLELPSSEYPAWLAGLAGERATHREALGVLLAHRTAGETNDFLAELPALDFEAVAPATNALVPGAHVGAYRLIEVIGQGGMGTVWLAERHDGLMHRRVALKLPRSAWDDAFAERLAREREILAALEHEHIARLYDAGIDAQGRPFLAMEYVEGETLDAYCQARALPVRERVALLIQVMAAVSHAHARLVVHRDLKPGNILVASGAQVKLLDFGIAKLLEGDHTQRTALTELSGRALTLDYASPEQIRGEPLGTASDIYSLGVVAYELLTHARPYRLRRGSAAEIEEAIASADPLLASEAAGDRALSRQLRGDLDAILNKALKKVVAQRYQSVDAFAQDLARYLDGQPVLAQPDSRRYRAGKFVRRHRFALAMSTALGASVIVGAGFSLWQAREARLQAARAEAEVDAQLAVRDLYRETLMTLSAQGSRDATALGKPHAIVNALRDKLGEVESRYTAKPTARDAQLDAVALQLNYDGDVEGSLAVARQLLASLKKHGAGADRVIRADGYVSSALYVLKRFDESEEARREAIAWDRQDVSAVTVAARSFAYKDLGSLLMTQGRRAEARQVLDEGDALMDRMFPDGEFTFVPLQLSSLYIGFDEAKALQFARKGHKAALARPESDADQRAFDLLTLGTALGVNGEQAQAEAELRGSLKLLLDLYSPANAGVMRVFNRMVGAVSRQGDYARAATLLAGERTTLATLPGGIARSAETYLQARDAERSWLAGDIAQASRFTPPAPDAVFAGSIRSDNDSPFLASVQLLDLAGRHDEALALLVAMRQKWPNPGQPTALWVRLELAIATAQLGSGDAKGAAATAKALCELLKEQHAATGSAFRTAAELEALAVARQGDRAGAAAALALGDSASPAPPFASPVERADSRLRRAEVLAGLGRADAAATAARAALADLATQHPDSPRLRDARRLAGVVSAVR